MSDVEPHGASAPGAGSPGAGPWHDLAHPVTEEMARVATFPSPRIRKLLCRPGDPMDVTTIELCCHVGTHVDAPRHFIDGGPTIDELPLERFHGPGVVVDASGLDDYGTIDVDVFADAAPAIRRGDIVLVHAGWSAYFEDERYHRNPALTVAAAEWLVARGVKLVGVDFGTPDIALDRRPAGFDWPVHRVLLGAGVLVVEHLRGLAPLRGRRLEVSCLPINIAGADGAPARVVARPLPDVGSDGDTTTNTTTEAAGGGPFEETA